MKARNLILAGAMLSVGVLLACNGGGDGAGNDTSVQEPTTLPGSSLSRQAVISLVAEKICPQFPSMFDDDLSPEFDRQKRTWTVRFEDGAVFTVRDDAAEVFAENEDARTKLSLYPGLPLCGGDR